ncbi:hypothetical protein ACFFRR_006678 [Megaselia abdita]
MVFGDLNLYVILLFVLLIFNTRPIDGMTCDSCGNECASACGTKSFKTCCFNYLRKRSVSSSNSVNYVSQQNLMDTVLGRGKLLYTWNHLISGSGATRFSILNQILKPNRFNLDT